ncbi:hypothetical protein BG844_35890 [Couchioplanes caeruleus subsp. caeruleus]|uniref:Uncharacterized protein n=1 Tax=Couchioplanes caeruleus subsp. caeruleus TaxID=56427 RepID=A0A1K0GKN0_9ACTN|nr:hypothetical protein BG844_35890 [Couchioplanes caeruleus subsp. caeruleus]
MVEGQRRGEAGRVADHAETDRERDHRGQRAAQVAGGQGGQDGERVDQQGAGEADGGADGDRHDDEQGQHQRPGRDAGAQGELTVEEQQRELPAMPPEQHVHRHGQYGQDDQVDRAGGQDRAPEQLERAVGVDAGGGEHQ